VRAVRKRTAAVGSAAFFALTPAIVAGVVPWYLTGWNPRQPLTNWWPPAVAGGALVFAGAAALALSFVRFVSEGVGTPAPVAPTERLVVGGPYRYVRNSMYLAVTATIVGQALLLGHWPLLIYAATVCTAMAAFVHSYEEPALARRFGESYRAYRRAVPAWRPRRRPWTQNVDEGGRLCAETGGAPYRWADKVGSVDFSVRQMELAEAQLIIDYFHSAAPEHLELLGVDPTRLPDPGRWMDEYAADYCKPIGDREFMLVVWERNGEQVGFSTADKIRFGHEAYMHLHVVDPQHRRAGIGLRCVRDTVRLYFDFLQLERLFCEPNAFNVAPNRTLQRAGFRYVKTHMTVPGRLNYHQAVTR
jgi:protein-S-isoprenylcysteine O-methyltransferase Ste14/RimJ/RimL family protein N-acetyltransferase